MKIIANKREIEVSSIVSTTIHNSGKNYPALKFIFEDGISADDLEALTSGEIDVEGNIHEGYNTLSEVSAVVGKITTVEQERNALEDKLAETKAEQAEMQESVNILLPTLDDETALSVKNLYPSFDEIIGQKVKQGFRFRYEDKLYKVIQPELVIESHRTPGEGTESLYTEICESHVGTVDDPIPYNGNMELENGKYYVQDDVIYLCTRDSGTAMYHNLSDLVGQYVEVYSE